MFLYIGIVLGIVAMAVGVPIFVVFALSGGIILVFHLHVTWYEIGHAMFFSITKYSLVALPLYILLGAIMLQGGLARRLTDVMVAYFGHLRGGLGIAAVVGIAFFSAISGSILAAIITMGTIMIPMMVKNGYPKPLAGAIIASAAGLDTLIPPSGAAILYCSITGSSLSKVFMSGVIPGIVQALLLLVVAVFMCRKLPRMPAVPRRERLAATYRALPVLVLPVIILGGIYTGWILPTEAAALACILALIIGFVIYRDLTVRKLWVGLVSSARSTAIVFIIIATASFLSLVFIYTNIPQNVTATIVSAGVTPTSFLLLAMIVWLILGTFLEAVPNILITVPIFMVIAQRLGVDLIHMYVPFVIFVGMGLLTPPVAVGAYTAASVAHESPDQIFRYVYPWFFLAMLVSGIINIFVPGLSLWLPSTMK